MTRTGTLVGASGIAFVACTFDLADVSQGPAPDASAPEDAGEVDRAIALEASTPDATTIDAPSDAIEDGPCVQSQTKSGTAALSDNSVLPGQAWQNPDKALAADGVETQSNIGSPAGTAFLVVTGFGFAIPSSATIRGIQARFLRRTASANDAEDQSVHVVKSWPGSLATIDRSVAALWLATAGYVTFGGPTDLWGDTITPQIVNQTTFGTAIKARGRSTGTAFVDHVDMTIWYDVCPGG